MKLTIKQKIAAYKYALDQVRQASQRCDYWICCHLSEYFNFELDIEQNFSEFFNLDTGRFEGWWPCNEEGRKTRIKVLTEIISDLEKQLK